MISGILIWIMASSHLKRAISEKRIMKSGPYKYIRHPIYVSIYMLSIGLRLIFFSWYWFIVLAVFIPLWYHECLNEERELIKLHKIEYNEYRVKTGMFFPVKFR